MGRAYALISPCRNEAKYMRKTLDSVTRQTVPPSLWVVVDDGSTDQTPQILTEYAAKFDFIRVVQRKDRGKRSVGPGVIEAFHAYRHVRNAYLRFQGLARTEYFGNARDTAHILQTTTADVEVMVHPRLDDYGRLVDLDGQDLESQITALRIPAAEMCSYYGL